LVPVPSVVLMGRITGGSILPNVPSEVEPACGPRFLTDSPHFALLPLAARRTKTCLRKNSKQKKLMASPTNPPEEKRKVINFNPLVLERTVIAVPLLKKMQEDFELIAVVKEFHPKEVLEFN